MPQPYNYAIDVAAPFQSAVQGLQLGRSLEEMQVEREQRAMQLAAMRQKMAQAEAEAQMQAQMSADLGRLAQKGGNATGADYAAIITKYPQLSEHFKRGWDILAPEQQQARVGNASRVLSALYSGNKQIAVDDLMEQADAARNSGKVEEAKAAEAIARVALQNPLAAQQMLEMTLVTALGPKEFMDNIGKNKRLPEEIKQEQGKAAQELAKGKYAEQREAAEVAKLWQDADFRREELRLRALEAQNARTDDDLKRESLQLRIKEQRDKIDAAAKDRVAAIDSSIGAIDLALTSVAKIMKHPGLDKAVGPVKGKNPITIRKDSADFQALVGTLRSEIFLSQYKGARGSGQISNIEGEKFEKAVANLDLAQTPEQFRDNLTVVDEFLRNNRRALAKTYPTSTPAASNDVGVEVDEETAALLRDVYKVRGK